MRTGGFVCSMGKTSPIGCKTLQDFSGISRSICHIKDKHAIYVLTQPGLNIRTEEPANLRCGVELLSFSHKSFCPLLRSLQDLLFIYAG